MTSIDRKRDKWYVREYRKTNKYSYRFEEEISYVEMDDRYFSSFDGNGLRAESRGNGACAD